MVKTTEISKRTDKAAERTKEMIFSMFGQIYDLKEDIKGLKTVRNEKIKEINKQISLVKKEYEKNWNDYNNEIHDIERFIKKRIGRKEYSILLEEYKSKHLNTNEEVTTSTTTNNDNDETNKET